MEAIDEPPVGSDEFLASVREAVVAPGAIALWYLGAAGYILKSEQATILIDPFLGPSNPPLWLRCIPPPFAADEIATLGPIDAVLLTHEHDDHTDSVTLAALAAHTTASAHGPAACVAVARAAGMPAARCRAMSHDEAFTVGDLRVTAVRMIDGGAPEANGYLIETGAQSLLHCGDAVYSDCFLAAGKRWQIDTICLSVASNPPGQTWYLDEADAARAARDAGARTLIPQHFDLWQGITLDPERVRVAAGWYCPETTVIPARFRQRISLDPGV